MKKILYLIIFSFIFLIGINDVLAEREIECIYDYAQVPSDKIQKGSTVSIKLKRTEKYHYEDSIGEGWNYWENQYCVIVDKMNNSAEWVCERPENIINYEPWYVGNEYGYGAATSIKFKLDASEYTDNNIFIFENEQSCPAKEDIVFSYDEGDHIYIISHKYSDGAGDFFPENTPAVPVVPPDEDGLKFEKLVKILQPYFQLLSKNKNINISGKLLFDINGKTTSFPWYNVPELSVLPEELEYVTEQKIKDVVEYCNEYYKNASENRKDQDSFKKRMDECIGFNEMLKEAASLGLIENLAEGCAMLSNGFTEILKKILDIVKIAGPILALALGTLDFVKAITSNDADKELKTAFKRASTRILAAVLLFIIPFILAFLMDRFLINQDGYDPDNPFCSMVDWSNE